MSSRRFFNVLATTPKLIRMVWQVVPVTLSLSLAVTGLRGVLPAAQLWVNKLIVDQIVVSLNQGESVWSRLVLLVAIRFGLDLASEFFNQANNYMGQLLSDRFTLHANATLLGQAIQLDLAHFESSEFYDILSRAQKSGSAYPVRVLTALRSLFGQVVSFASLLGLLIQFHGLAVLALILTSLPAFWIGIRFSARRFWMMRRETQAGRLADYLQQVLTYPEFAKEVRIFNLGRHLQHQWRDIRSDFNRKSANLARRYVMMRGTSGTLSNLGFYGAFVWILVQTVRGRITLGDFTMYTGAFTQAQSLLPSILETIAQIYEFNLYVSQYFEFLQLTPHIFNGSDPKPFPTPIRQGLVLKDVSFAYPGTDTPIVKDLTLTVRPNENIALVGRNGAGKTTLLKLITRLYDVTSGEITLDGIPLSQISLAELRQNIGVLSQDFARYQLKVQDNIGFGNLSAIEQRDRIEQAAENAGAADLISELDQGYSTVLGKIFQDGVELSGGQWQKIGTARAFMSEAPILILDEPTAALDAIAEHDLFQKFRQLSEGKITFFVSHRFSTVLMADRIIVLEDGKILEMGSHQALMKCNGLYAEMFTLQASGYGEVPQSNLYQ